MDDGWKVVEVEPEAVQVNGNGANGNGHQHDDGIGPTVELPVLSNGHANGNGHAAIPANGNGRHDDEADWSRSSRCSPGRSSWPRSRSSRRAQGKPQAPSLSLFEWAVEQEREEEPVGAGR